MHCLDTNVVIAVLTGRQPYLGPVKTKTSSTISTKPSPPLG